MVTLIIIMTAATALYNPAFANITNFLQYKIINLPTYSCNVNYFPPVFVS